MRCPAAKPIASATAPENRNRTVSSRKGGQYSTTIREEVKAELQISAKATPSPSARQSRPRAILSPVLRFGCPS